MKLMKMNSIPLSKQKNIASNFSDGKLLKEVIKYYLLKIVDKIFIHHHNTNQKISLVNIK
jgi:hypothetical protein